MFFASGISLIVEYGITTESIKYESTIDKYNLRLKDSKGLVSYAAFHRFNAWSRFIITVQKLHISTERAYTCTLKIVYVHNISFETYAI